MKRLLQPLPYESNIVYLDDTSLWADSLDELGHAIIEVCEQMSKEGLKFNG